MKITNLKTFSIFVVLCIALAFSGCNTAQNTNTNTSNGSSSSNSTNANTAVVKNDDASSPASVLRSYLKALNKKDVAEMKKHLSQSALKWLDENLARKNKQTVDETLAQVAAAGEGDKGNIEYKTVWQNDKRAYVVPIIDGSEGTGIIAIKEGSDWKLDFHLMWENLEATRKAGQSGD